ncbi:MAG: Kae1-associated serine/threonine protein kinase [Candidatus Marsarchaeota archaeon]|nr:Kae1-associated serine/threonine protein kinase [Candidatus Marsarchaeota archaeon]MCL5413562.1 Kae1-associated serine/threonine protein kinase [Candidatus Marsarchaeota archaeon]
MKKIGEGAEALIYAAKIYGADVIIKYRQRKMYRAAELDTKLRKTRTRKEAKIIARVLEHGIPAPALIGIGNFSIYMERISGIMLKDTRISANDAALAGLLLGKLHNAGVTHGDFTPANLIKSGKNIRIIDFGLSNINKGSEERALDLLLMKRQLSPRLFSEFSSGYLKAADSGNDTIKRLEEILERGRYQTRTLA